MNAVPDRWKTSRHAEKVDRRPVKLARLLALGLLGLIFDIDDPESVTWFVVGSIAAVVAAGILVYQLPIRGIAWATAILAAMGMLVYFYVALALVATIAADNEPRNRDLLTATASDMTYGLIDVVLAALLVVGFEVVIRR